MFTFVGLATIVVAFGVFSFLNVSLQQHSWIPVSPPQNYASRNQQHKWRNCIGSLVHAIVMGVLSILSLPGVWPDFVKNYTQLGDVTLAITIGYAIYDTFDLILNKPLGVVWPLLVHHLIAGFFSSLLLWRQEYLGYGILCATVEVNSVFLHIRQLLLMYGVSKNATVFKSNTVLNFATFAFLRIPSFTLILVFLIDDRVRMISYWNTAMFFGTSGLLVINLILFRRLIMSDFIGKKHEKVEVNSNIMDN